MDGDKSLAEVESLARQAAEAFARGEADLAVAVFVQALRLRPDIAPVWSNLGVVLLAQGRHAEAEGICRNALAIDPTFAEAHYNLGNALSALGRSAEAEAEYGQAVALRPGYAEALCNLGSTLERQGRLDEAIAAYQDAVAARPDLGLPCSNLGNALQAAGRGAEALAALDRATQLSPDLPEAWGNLGNSLRLAGREDQAVAAYAEALRLRPAYAEAWTNLGVALYDKGRFDDAETAHRQALALDPALADGHLNLGAVLRDTGRFAEATASWQQTIALRPDYVAAWKNLGISRQMEGDLDGAMAAFRRALEIEPDNAQVHFDIAYLHLLRGEMAEGWEQYEWRWKTGMVPPRGLPQPLWDGKALPGTLLVHAEQGMGDTLQFCRYLPLLRGQAGHVVFEVQAPLLALLRGLPGVDTLVAAGKPLPPFDAQVPLMSLPRLLGTRLDSIPAEIPYLHPDPQRVEAWRHRLGDDDGRRRVGLVWAGAGRPGDSAARRVDARRSMALSCFAPLAAVDGVRFYSLQKDPPASLEARTPPAGMDLTDPMGEVADFADTAALVSLLDLVIAVDTSTAHLAGALGKPVWILSRFDNCWRWLLDRADSPWYPTARLYRQSRFGEWADVMERVAADLAAGERPA